MFDVSFSELLVIAVVALLVIGPEKLPKVARTLGAFAGRMQRYMAQVKEEVNREMRFEELQNLQQEIKRSVEKAVDQESTALQASIYEASSPAKIMTDSKSSSIKPKVKARSATKIVKPKTTKQAK
jgi:sec-independent protein translocase protein TatB